MKPLHLYIHIPFCRKKCAYCDFYSLPAEERVPDYIHALKCALHGHAKDFSSKYEINTIYFGGGTPNILSGKQLNEIFICIRENFHIADNAECTIEINPEFSASAEALQALGDIGFNRLSIGIQSLSDRDLGVLGRLHTADTALRCLEYARTVFDNISVDLIYAVPGQSRDALKQNIDRILFFSPEHISAYNLTYEPGTPMAKAVMNGETSPADEESERSDFLFIHEYLTERGYEHYEISNFARPGFRSRHNSAYWSKHDYLGIGPSAHSKIGDLRCSYEADLEQFLKKPEHFHTREPASEADILITRLRTNEGLKIDCLRSDTWDAVMDYAKDHPRWFVTDAGSIRCTSEGWLMLDTILEELV